VVAIVSRSIFVRPHRRLLESGRLHTNHNRFIRIKKFRDGHLAVFGHHTYLRKSERDRNAIFLV
ncbi:MAG: hypothetical protein ACLPSW_17320, partial [Roseiarcus sp.]